jgi:ketosteroid isomerase-like protein
MPDLTQNFIAALGRLEEERDVDTIAGLFADDAEVANPMVHHESGGAEAARSFWSQYRDAFDEIHSDFRTVTEKDGTAFLEWTSKGSLDGKPFTYGGVTLLVGDGDRITSFRTYFDTRHIPSARAQGETGTSPAASGSEAGTEGGQPHKSGSEQAAAKETGGIDTDGKEVSVDDIVDAQRDASEQRAGGGYS